jgi:GT2 family glycosyltransferase
MPGRAPRFSVLTTVHDPPAELLEATIASVEGQLVDDWELVLVDDASTSPRLQRILAEAAARDSRIRVIRRSSTGGAVAASNEAVAGAHGTYLALVEVADELHPEALSLVGDAIDEHAGAANIVYTDEVEIDADGVRGETFRKPDWSPDRLRGQPYTGHLSVFRRALVDELGGFRPGFDSVRDFELTLRVSERAGTVLHVREPLYLRRHRDGSTGASGPSGVRAVQEHCDRTGFEARVSAGPGGLYRLDPVLRAHPPVSIVIPTAARAREILGQPVVLAEQCVRGIVERSTYDNYEIVLVVDEDVPAPLRRRIEAVGGDRLAIIRYDRPFNFAEKCNLGAVLSEGEHLLFLNDDTDVITPGWIEAMLMYSRSPGVGAVGARLLFGDGRIQHVGVGMNVVVVNVHHLYSGYTGDHAGYFDVCRTPCNWSAVTAACLMSPRTAFEEVGGFSVDLPVNFNDVDYCLKLGEAGYRVVCTPGAELHHHEFSTRPAHVSDAELDTLTARWRSFQGDPYLPRGLRHINFVFD